MDWFTGVVVYILVWWVMIFCLLPVRLKSDKELPENSDPQDGWAGAPQSPMIKEKMIATTILSFVVWGVIYLLISAEILSFHDIAKTMIEEDYK